MAGRQVREGHNQVSTPIPACGNVAGSTSHSLLSSVLGYMPEVKAYAHPFFLAVGFELRVGRDDESLYFCYSRPTEETYRNQ